jgi:hypothetical protein
MPQHSESTHSMLRQIKAARERGTQPRSESALRCKNTAWSEGQCQLKKARRAESNPTTKVEVPLIPPWRRHCPKPSVPVVPNN